MKLLEVFHDFEVVVKGGSQHSRYSAIYKIIPREDPKPLTINDLERYISQLQQRYPERNFKLRRYRNFYIISQKTTIAPKQTQQEINQLKRRLKEVNRRVLQTVVDRYESIILTQKLKKLRRRVRKKKDVVPLYFMVEDGQLTGRVFVPETYVKTRPKLVNYICMRTLGSLGMSQSKFVRMLPR